MRMICLIVLAAGTALGATARETAPAIVAHRGAMSERPENTMAAFEHAVELGAAVVEIDVRISSDGHGFILHDSTLDRTTGATGAGEEHSLAELQSLDAGAWFAPEYAGTRIPSLAEVLAWGKDETILLLDLKGSGPEYADQVAAEVLEHSRPDRVVVGVRSVRQAREFRERLPDAPQLGFMRSPDDIEDFAGAGVDILRLWLRWLRDDDTLAGRVRATGKKLMINGTVGELEEARALMHFAPDWILIDDVMQLQRSLEILSREGEASVVP